METIGVVLNTIIATMRTEELLAESQRLASELQSGPGGAAPLERRSSSSRRKSLKASEELLQAQQEELQQTNEELEEKATLLEQQNRDIEVKNQAIEGARLSLAGEGRAARASARRYKSEFLANMSHELRTPLNSLLILSRAAGRQPDRQPDATSRSSSRRRSIDAGTDLLDADRRHPRPVEGRGRQDGRRARRRSTLARVCDYVERTFEPLAAEKGLDLSAVLVEEERLPEAIVTDEQRLQQILKNLLSNAFKFTSEGTVSLRIGLAPAGLRYANDALGLADTVIAFTVTDTGIGIEHDKLRC